MQPHFLGIRFTEGSLGEIAARIIDRAARGEGGWLLTPNLSIARQLQDPALAWILERATEVTLDGAPLAWLARRHGIELGARVTGADLVPAVLETAPAAMRLLIVGGPPEAVRVADQMASDLGLDVVGAHVPPFGFDRDENGVQDEAARIDVTGDPQLIIMALGFPRQENLGRALQARFPDAYLMHTGAALAFWTGEQSRAPRWMQRLGVEWLHRLASEPRRLARRYLGQDLPFLLRNLRRTDTVAEPRPIDGARVDNESGSH